MPCGVFGDCHDGGGVGLAVNLIVAGDCNGEYFYGGDYADNTLSATNKPVEIVAVLPAAAPGGEDEISAVTGRVFVAKTPEVFTYDADGNLTGDGRFIYTWNDENRMVSASNAEVVVTYAYDHKGRMVSKTIARVGAAPQTVTYIWDGWNIIREAVATNSLFTIHSSLFTYNLWGLDLDGTMQGAGGVGGLLAVVREDGETYLPTYDANGNISEYLSASDGTVAAHYDYSPFGETLVASGPLASSFTHRFSTKPYCQTTGFCEYQMRKYRPGIGRWMSRDPIGEGGGVNLYCFCGNDEVANVDSFGEISPKARSYSLFPPYMDIALIPLEYIAETEFKFLGYKFWREFFVDSPHWQILMDDWFFEKNAETRYFNGIANTYNRDIASNPGFKKLLACWIDASHGGFVPSRRWSVNSTSFQWQYTLDRESAAGGSAAFRPETEFLGSYTANVTALDSVKASSGMCRYAIKVVNESSWLSATRYPGRLHSILSKVGVDSPSVFQSHPRKAWPLSLGGNMKQTYQFEIQMPCCSKCELP